MTAHLATGGLAQSDGGACGQGGGRPLGTWAGLSAPRGLPPWRRPGRGGAGVGAGPRDVGPIGAAARERVPGETSRCAVADLAGASDRGPVGGWGAEEGAWGPASCARAIAGRWRATGRRGRAERGRRLEAEGGASRGADAVADRGSDRGRPGGRCTTRDGLPWHEGTRTTGRGRPKQGGDGSTMVTGWPLCSGTVAS